MTRIPIISLLRNGTGALSALSKAGQRREVRGEVITMSWLLAEFVGVGEFLDNNSEIAYGKWVR